MRTIPTLLAAAAIAAGTTVAMAPAASAGCPQAPGVMIGSNEANDRLGAALGCGGPDAPAPPLQAPPQAPAPQAPVVIQAPPAPAVVPPQGMSPGPESSWPGGVAADCANAAYAAHYNFFCADVGTGNGAPAASVPTP
jgi:hypothetical protein